MTMSEQHRKALLRRKKRLGRSASYRKLGSMIGRNQSMVYRVLNGQDMPFNIGREQVLEDIKQALDEIEAKSGAAAGKTERPHDQSRTDYG